MIYFISDLHFFHDREFIWRDRGFDSEEQMRKAYIEEWNRVVKGEDDVYMCGDLCLGSNHDLIKELVANLPGRIHLIIGNHDTDAKLSIYKDLPNVVEIVYATVLIYKHRKYYVSHYVTDTSSLDSDPNTCVINIHGHIHEKKLFTCDKPYLINVSVDATDGHFMTFEDVEKAFKKQVEKCASYCC